MNGRLLVFVLFIAAGADAQQHGRYVGNVVVRWNGDGRTMTLTEPFAYVDPAGTRWDAPAGATVDGASIPRFAWALIGGPFEGQYRDSSVIHDVACEQKSRSWDAVHEAFYTGMLASGVSTAKAKVMYAAVYHFGPRWPTRVEVRSVVTEMANHLQCIDVSVLGRVCTDMPEQVSREVVTAMEVPPEPQHLSRDEFDRLAAAIESTELGSTRISLDQIQHYKRQPQ